MASARPRGSPSSPGPPFMQPDLSILNAVQYDIGALRPATRAARGAKRKMAAAFARSLDVAGNPRGSTSSRALSTTPGDDNKAPEDEAFKPLEASKKKKLKRPTRPAAPPDSDDGEGDGDYFELEHGSAKKRARGRPRIDIKDVTAADRRRTQIRLAQRAYRNRKERAIVTLEKKVQSLKDGNEAMGKAFMRLHDFAIRRGLLDAHPDFASQLRQTTEVFLEIARQSSAGEDDEEGEGESEGEGEDEEDRGNDGDAPSSEALPAGAPEAVDDFEMRQKAIADAVMTFGFQTRQSVTGRRPSLPEQTMVPSLSPTRHARDPAYVSMAFQQPLYLSARLYGQTDTPDGLLGMASGILDSVAASPSEPSVSGAASLCSTVGSSENVAAMPSTGTSSNSSAVSLSPVPGATVDDYTGQLQMGDSPMLSLPPYAPPTLPESTSDLAPYLASTHDFISAAALGSPRALPLPTRYPVNVPFGLRLWRQAVQEAYKFISAPDPAPDVFARVFGFSISFEQVLKIRRRLRRGLELPVFDICKSTWELRYVTGPPGPDGKADAAAPDRGNTPNSRDSDHRGLYASPAVPRPNARPPGFDGPFFDCEETETYLEQHGVHIPPNTYNVIVEVDDSNFGVGETGSAAGGRGSQSAAIESGVVDATFGAMPSPTSLPDLSFSMPATDKGGSSMAWSLDDDADVIGTFAAATGRDASSTISGEAAMMASITFPPRRLLTLDVDRFLNELAARASCLGQTPGFRETDINEAFWRSTQRMP